MATFLILLGVCAWWPDLRAAGELASEEGIWIGVVLLVVLGWLSSWFGRGT